MCRSSFSGKANRQELKRRSPLRSAKPATTIACRLRAISLKNMPVRPSAGAPQGLGPHLGLLAAQAEPRGAQLGQDNDVCIQALCQLGNTGKITVNVAKQRIELNNCEFQ